MPHNHGLSDEIDREPNPQIIAIEDTDRSISRTHLILGVYSDELWVADAASGNGSVLVYPDGNAYPLDPWTRYVVDPGSTVRFGDRWFRVYSA
ncbi:pSer/pThr/pTyr-binding forkhead associated (FHA) protein [Mycetocola sp. BIGb0189]|uniref:FHA domain-containing protein n=1 Tax=Mycetocola sp. BIGb0189 TaxID=2940604 RepID=UPI0037C6CB34|nr:pSer/pThr/pTyr-binding forkhead associated (FHA) protein [Mycetocola sp. BIGb0189]